MQKHLLPNRSAKAIPADALDQARQAFQTLHNLLGTDTPIDEEAYQRLYKIADKRKIETDDVFAVIRENQEFLDTETAFEEIEKDKAFYELCDQLRSLQAAFDLRLNREQNIAGAEYLDACKGYEASVTYRVSRGNSKAQAVKTQLDAIARSKAGPRKKSSDSTPPTA
jgi:hypothetical protein